MFGERAGARVLPALVAISAFGKLFASLEFDERRLNSHRAGNLVAVLIGQSRIVREIGRQGVLPYPRLWASPKPFGTPALGIFVTWVSFSELRAWLDADLSVPSQVITVIMTIAPPAGDAFNFVVDLQVSFAVSQSRSSALTLRSSVLPLECLHPPLLPRYLLDSSPAHEGWSSTLRFPSVVHRHRLSGRCVDPADGNAVGTSQGGHLRWRRELFILPL